jgi:hypothetical protein
MQIIKGYKLAITGTIVLILAGCSGKIVRVEIDPGTPIVCDTAFNTPCGVTDTQPVKIRVWGEGKCDSVGVKMGDGSSRFSPNPFDFGKSGASTPLELTYTYALAWPGIKTIHAYSASNCLGEAFETIRVMRKTGTAVHADFTFGFAEPQLTAPGQPVNPGDCTIVPHVRALRSNTRVSVTTNPDPNIKINFGCAFGGCIYGADGEQGSVAPAGFPFPGFAKYSLILKVGSQTVQGGSRVTFTTNQSGPLEVCVNDDVTSDNTGAWGITFAVDESQAP